LGCLGVTLSPLCLQTYSVPLDQSVLPKWKTQLPELSLEDELLKRWTQQPLGAIEVPGGLSKLDKMNPTKREERSTPAVSQKHPGLESWLDPQVWKTPSWPPCELSFCGGDFRLWQGPLCTLVGRAKGPSGFGAPALITAVADDSAAMQVTTLRNAPSNLNHGTSSSQGPGKDAIHARHLLSETVKPACWWHIFTTPSSATSIIAQQSA
jgi:hypothetical protein